MIEYNQEEEALDGIVSQDGDVFEIGYGYSVRFRIKKVPKSQQRPHGLDYALTMHAPGGRRLVGYDNAHVPEELKSSSRAGRQMQACDHIHYEGRRVKSYDFRTPGGLMEDFWVSVDAKLKEEGIDE
jgi:hypothetical protein